MSTRPSSAIAARAWSIPRVMSSTRFISLAPARVGVGGGEGGMRGGGLVGAAQRGIGDRAAPRSGAHCRAGGRGRCRPASGRRRTARRRRGARRALRARRGPRAPSGDTIRPWPARRRASSPGEIFEDAQIVERVDVARHGQREREDVGALGGVARHERDRLVSRVEIIADREALGQDQPVDLEAGDEPLRVVRAKGGALLVALGEIDDAMVVIDALQIERDAHAIGRRGAEIIVEDRARHGRRMF